MGLEGASAFGVDIDHASLRKAKELTPGQFTNSRAEQLPFKEGVFDKVVSTDAFEHIEGDVETLNEIKRVLKKGGIFVIYVPYSHGLLSKTRAAQFYHDEGTSLVDVREGYTLDELVALLKKVDMEVFFSGYDVVFIQEFITQLAKAVLKMGNVKYETQKDIGNIQKSGLYKFMNTAFFPLAWGIIQVENFFTAAICGRKITGHRLIVAARKK